VSQVEGFDLSDRTELVLADKGFGPDLGSALVEGAPDLVTLDVRGNLLGATGATSLASLEKLETLRLGPGRIYGEGNRIGAAGARGLLAASGSLTDVDLSKNQVDGAAFEVVKQPLVRLVVDSNPIGDEGCAAIARIETLEVLHLGWSGVGDACAEALSGHAGIRELLLSSNGVTDLGVAALARMPKLETLYVSNNSLTQATPLAHVDRLNVDGNALVDRETLVAAHDGSWLSAEAP